MKRKKKKIVKSQMLSLKGKIEKYLTKEDYYDLFNKAKASLNISKIYYKGTYIFARLIGKNFITATELDFSSSYEYGKVDLVNLETLTKSLEENTSLTKLNFSKNNICEKGLTYFASIIAKNKTITNLDLSLNNNCSFTGSKPSGLDAIGLSLKDNKTLVNLNLSYINLRTAGTEKELLSNVVYEKN
jgi:Ran GTPase-activating protein (RanGAP) involved in mRNA processing and transport